MRKEICSSCSTKLPAAVSFCPQCDHPTKLATDAERVEWDLRRWRQHVDRSIVGRPPVEGTAREQVIARVQPPPRVHPTMRAAAAVAVADAPQPIVVATPQPVVAPALDPIHLVEPQHDVPEPMPPRNAPAEAVDFDDPFAYRSCVTCERTDWIVRTTQNDDETWNYWCVRCSRSFKSQVKLRYALKPFLSAGVVLGGLTATSLLLLH